MNTAMNNLGKFICLSVAVLSLALMAFTLLTLSSKRVASDSSKLGSDSDSAFSLLQSKAVTNVFRWEREDGQFFLCVALKTVQNKGEQNVIFRIYNSSGEALYEQNLGGLGEIERIYSVYALRQNAPQLAIEVNSGGSSSTLYLLDYRDGKVENLIDPEESDFDISCEIRPQFQSLQNIRKLPFQIYLTSQMTSSSEPEIDVFSFKDGKYINDGKIQASKVAAYSEKIKTHDTK